MKYDRLNSVINGFTGAIKAVKTRNTDSIRFQGDGTELHPLEAIATNTGGITTTDASLLTSGTLSDARLSGNVVLESELSAAVAAAIVALGPLDKTIVLPGDVINANASANTMANITGLSFPVLLGKTYEFTFTITYDAAAITTGSRFSINGGTVPTYLVYTAQNTFNATGFNLYEGLQTFDLPATSNGSSLTTGNTTIIRGFITASANDTIIARFASEVSSSAITAKGGLSTVKYKQLN